MPEESTTPDLGLLWQRVIDAGNARDIEAALSLFAPDSVFDTSSIGLGSFTGRAAIRGLFEDWWSAFEEYEQRAEDIRALGNGVTFSIVVMRGRPPQSSAWVEQRYAAFATWTNGLIERTTNSFDIDQARAAAERRAEERGRDA